MGMSRMVLFSALTLYLVLAVVISTAMENTYQENLIQSEGHGVSQTTATFNLAIHFNTSYFWIDFALIYFEFIIWIVLLIGFFLPTINQGQ